MTEVLKVLNEQIYKLNLNYEFGQMAQSPPKYPYWVGEYTETEPLTEDGLETPTIILTGFSRGKFIELEQQKQIIKNHFKHGISVITDSGSAVVLFYTNSLNIPLEEPDLKKCQVNISVKIWKGK